MTQYAIQNNKYNFEKQTKFEKKTHVYFCIYGVFIVHVMAKRDLVPTEEHYIAYFSCYALTNVFTILFHRFTYTLEVSASSVLDDIT